MIIKLLLYCIMAITAIKCYNTMPPVWGPSPYTHAFTVSFVNTAPYNDSTQTNTVIPYPAGITYTTPPKIVPSIIRY